MAKKVVVYSKDYCPYCDQAKALLNSRGIDFEVIEIQEWSIEKIQALFAKSGMRTVPQIFVGDDLIGGFQDLEALDRQKGLSHLK